MHNHIDAGEPLRFVVSRRNTRFGGVAYVDPTVRAEVAVRIKLVDVATVLGRREAQAPPTLEALRIA